MEADGDDAGEAEEAGADTSADYAAEASGDEEPAAPKPKPKPKPASAAAKGKAAAPQGSIALRSESKLRTLLKLLTVRAAACASCAAAANGLHCCRRTCATRTRLPRRSSSGACGPQPCCAALPG
jgi:hypothetical protein